MRLFLSTVFSIIIYVISFAQIPLSQIEGRLDVHLPYDSTSAHIGFHAGEEQDANDIFYNTFIGSYTGQHNTSGGYNSFIESNAGWGNQTGESNTFVGFASGAHLVEANQNSYFGAFSGYGDFTETNEGDYNSYFGFGAGAATETGSFNSFFGRKAGIGSVGNNNILIGHNVGPLEQGSATNIDERLYIDIEQTSDPLLYGEFDNDLIRINGDLEAEGYIKVKGSETLTAPSYQFTSHHGRIYYDTTRNRMRVCTLLTGINRPGTGWKDMHDNTPD